MRAVDEAQKPEDSEEREGGKAMSSVFEWVVTVELSYCSFSGTATEN